MNDDELEAAYLAAAVATPEDSPVTDTDEPTPEPLELVAAGDTATPERTDPRTPDTSGTALTITEAAGRYVVSEATLRRQLAAGTITGAHKKPGPKGETWLLPAASLVALGYRERAEVATETAPPPPAPPPESAELVAVVDRLAELLAGQQSALMAAESDRTDARASAADALARLEMTTADLDRERARADGLAAELDAAREAAQARRGWFRRR